MGTFRNVPNATNFDSRADESRIDGFTLDMVCEGMLMGCSSSTDQAQFQRRQPQSLHSPLTILGKRLLSDAFPHAEKHLLSSTKRPASDKSFHKDDNLSLAPSTALDRLQRYACWAEEIKPLNAQNFQKPARIHPGHDDLLMQDETVENSVSQSLCSLQTASDQNAE